MLELEPLCNVSLYFCVLPLNGEKITKIFYSPKFGGKHTTKQAEENQQKEKGN